MTAIGQPLPRLEGVDKVTGRARYAGEVTVARLLHGWPVTATVAAGRITAIDRRAALGLAGVVTVLTHENAPPLAAVPDAELAVLQSPEVAYRGQVVALVVAHTPEDVWHGAELVVVSYDERPHDVVLTADHPGLYAPEKVNAGFATDRVVGDVDAALGRAAHVVDRSYSTPAQFNNPMEPHASLASWDGDHLLVHDSTQGTTSVRDVLGRLFDVPREGVRVRAEHVGGGFGAKGSARPNVVLAAMAARVTGRPVRVVLTRTMMFAAVGYRTPTVQRIRLGADGAGHLEALSHEAYVQTSRIMEFVEQVAEPTRHLYAAPARRTTHRVVPLDVHTPRWMRAPGETPGVHALETAMDELATAVGIDPVELRVANEPTVDPESGKAFSSRNLVACLRRGAERFGWTDRDARPGLRRDGRFLVGSGVAVSTYPAVSSPSRARARRRDDGRYAVEVNATDIGTGARTVLRQVAADALGVTPDEVELRLGDSDLPKAPVAGGSMGTASWSWAVTKACRELCDRVARGAPLDQLVVEVDTTDDVKARADLQRQAFGAQFAEVRVDLESAEVRVSRLLGVFAAGRILNPRTARSQLLGGMTMGVSMALHEEGVLDPVFGDHVNHDLASYHVATCADIAEIEAEWLDEHDDQLNPTASKGIGEIGIVGTAAAIGNAVWHATGIRIRTLPIQPDDLLDGLPRPIYR